jgi:hypothetical protein
MSKRKMFLRLFVLIACLASPSISQKLENKPNIQNSFTQYNKQYQFDPLTTQHPLTSNEDWTTQLHRQLSDERKLRQLRERLPSSLDRLSDIEEESPLTKHPEVVCRAKGISGFDRVHNQALRYVGPTTTDPSETKIFISVENERLYLHSNFLTPGFDNPTKIATNNNRRDLPTLAYNIIGGESDSGVSPDAFRRVFPQMHFYVDEKLFSDLTFGQLAFDDSAHVQIIGSDGEARLTSVLTLSNGTKERIVKYGDNIFGHVGDEDGLGAYKHLRSNPFRQDDIRLLSLVLNTSTSNAIHAQIPEKNQIQAKDLTPEAIISLLKEQQNRRVFILGHIEDGAFVTVDAAGRELLRMPISRLQEAAAANALQMFILGCHSASVSKAGINAAFNTVDVVERFAKALSSAQTVAEFYELIAGPDLTIVIDKSVTTKNGTENEMTMTVRRKATRVGGRRSRTVGTLMHTVTSATAAPIPTPSPIATDENGGTSGTGGQGNGSTISEAAPMWIWVALMATVAFFAVRKLRGKKRV